MSKKIELTEEEINEVIRLYNEELLGSPSISDKMGYHKKIIIRTLKENGVEMGPSGRRNIGGKSAAQKRYESKPEIKVKRSEYHKEYRIKNKQRLKEYNKKHNEDFKLKNGVSRHTLWDRENKARRKELLQHRLKTDPVFALKYKLRSSLNAIFRYKGYTKKHKSHDILGCSYEEFLTHLESKFEPWMNWDNRGLYNGEFNYGWDIDHIIPTSLATTEEELIKLCHYTNLQPLCSKVNRDIKKNNLEFDY